ncbi:PAS domain S-box protein [bacterium]|nr:MAG: PAS domain S-box protein [bacterium]
MRSIYLVSGNEDISVDLMQYQEVVQLINLTLKTSKLSYAGVVLQNDSNIHLLGQFPISMEQKDELTEFITEHNLADSTSYSYQLENNEVGVLSRIIDSNRHGLSCACGFQMLDHEFKSHGFCFFLGTNSIQKSRESLEILQQFSVQITNTISLCKSYAKLKKEYQKQDQLIELYSISQHMNMIGSWTFDYIKDKITWSKDCISIFEVPENFKINARATLAFFRPADGGLFAEQVKVAIKENGNIDFVGQIKTFNGTEKWVRITGTTVKNDDERNIFGNIQDITQYKEREKKLKHERFKALSVLEGTNVGTWEWNVQTGEMDVSERWAEIVGYSKDDLKPLNIVSWIKRVHSDDLVLSNELLEKCFNGESEYYELETRILHKSGSWIWVLNKGKVFSRTDENKPAMMYGTLQDITERKTKEELLRISEETFRGSFEFAMNGMALVGADGKWLKVNTKLCEILGYTEEELMQLDFNKITHPDDYKQSQVYYKAMLEGETNSVSYEKRYIHKNGTSVYIILSVSVIRNDFNEILYFVSQMVDITSMKLMELKLEDSLAYNKAILEASTQVAIIGADINGRITTFNDGAERMLGYSGKEMIGRPNLVNLFSHEQESYSKSADGGIAHGFDDYNSILDKAVQNPPDIIEYQLKREDGSTVPALVSLSAIKQNKKVVGVLAVAIDISAMKQVEHEMTSLLELTQSQNDRLKNFAHIVSHNLRSYSGALVSIIDLIRIQNPDLYQNEFIKYIANASENLSETIRHLTDVVHINFLPVDNQATIHLKSAIQRNFKGLLHVAHKENILIIDNVDKNVHIKGINAYVDSIINNLLTNAIKYRAVGRDSYIRIETELVEKYVILKFIDNGLGIDLKYNGHKLFGMYKTFHSHKDARGIGLFLTKNQVEAMQGKIEVESMVGVGTTFKVSLLKADE